MTSQTAEHDEHRATLRRLRELVVEPPHGFTMAPDLPNYRVRAALTWALTTLSDPEQIIQEDPKLRKTVQEFVEALAATIDPGARCATCRHRFENHAPGRCRKHRCGCGGWRPT